MDYRSQEEDDSMASLPLPYNNNNNNPNPNPNPNPNQNPTNPIRASAFTKPSPLLSPRLVDHSIRNGYPNDFTNNPIAPSPSAGTGTAAATTPKTPPAAAAAAAIKYRECLRNHAAAIGGHVLDGCCEFMPCDPDPLRCAACDCHRSFHRKYDPGSSEHILGSTTSSAYYQHRRERISVPLLLPPPRPTSAHTYNHRSQSQSQKQQFASSDTFPPSPSGVIPGGANSAVVAFGGLGGNNSGSGATTESSSEERLDGSTAAPLTTTQQQQQQQQQLIASKKRFRTKFTPDQKEKMMGFAERVGWRFQRQDDATVEQFCREVGVRRQVLKVWMHNNKHSLKKQQQQQEQQQQQPPPAAASAATTTTPSDSAAATTTFGHVMM